MKTICAWCQAELEGSIGTDDQYPISHGIYAKCSLEIEIESVKFEEFLNEFEFPILAIDGDILVQAGNTVAQELLQLTGEEFRNRLGGDVMRCVYANLPEGCGNTTHCTACSIRNTVEKTYNSGKSVKSAKAYQYLNTSEGPRMVEILISTEKIGFF